MPSADWTHLDRRTQKDTPSWLELAVHTRPMLGQQVCGDGVFSSVGDLHALLVVVDGLGHGPKAHEAAQSACAMAAENLNSSPSQLMQLMHRGLRGTVGAAVTILRVDRRSGTYDHAAIGNVEVRAPETSPQKPYSQAGVVGHRLRKVTESNYVLLPGQELVIYSDGISGRFDLGAMRGLAPRDMATRLMRERAKDHDDATCVIMRFSDNNEHTGLT